MKFYHFSFEFAYRLSTWFAQFPASEAFSKHSLRGFPAHILPYFWLQARLRVGVQTLLTSIFVPPWLPVSKTVKHKINILCTYYFQYSMKNHFTLIFMDPYI